MVAFSKKTAFDLESIEIVMGNLESHYYSANTIRRVAQGLALPWLMMRSIRAASYAKDKGLLGYEYGDFGRILGLRLICRAMKEGLPYLLTPVHCVRYFEYSFARSQLPAQIDRCLDVSSPRLFSLFALERMNVKHLTMINPDPGDLAVTTRLLKCIHSNNVTVINSKLQELAITNDQQFDAIWSISVIEHMEGENADTEAVQMLYRMLRPGGRLIITVPVDRQFRIEYSGSNNYGTSERKDEDERFFFQRIYNNRTLSERIVLPLGVSPLSIAFWGESRRGWFADYERRCKVEGHFCTVNDPRSMSDAFRCYSSFEEMPGMGVCGMAFEK